MSLDDTQSSAEIIVNSVLHDAHCELDNEQSPSTDYESIHSRVTQVGVVGTNLPL